MKIVAMSKDSAIIHAKIDSSMVVILFQGELARRARRGTGDGGWNAAHSTEDRMFAMLTTGDGRPETGDGG